MSLMPGRDAAFAGNIGTFSGVIGGYLNSPWAYHPWAPGDWSMFPQNRKLPIWVAGYDGKSEGAEAVDQMVRLGIAPGCPLVVDMETREDKTYIDSFFEAVRTTGGYKVLVYGSASTVFNNPACNGYWVALYDGIPSLSATWTNKVRGKQYSSGEFYDLSVWKPWVVQELWV